jgi:DNA polymerase III delta prime subunit
MKIHNSNSSVYYEKYKPSCVQDLILPKEIKDKIEKYTKTQKLPHLGLFSSNPGTGKSSTAYAILKEINGEALWINASLEKGIDVLRGKILKFASQTAFDDNIKIVVMDEMDNFTPDGQKAFRGFIDEFGLNCTFIFTGNYKEKIIEPLLERLEVYDFNAFKKEEMIKPIFERLKYILENEKTSYEPKDLIPVINTFYPKIRSMIGALQKYTNDGIFKVQESELDDLNIFDKVMQTVSMKTYTDMIISVNALNAPDNMFNYLYKNAAKYFKSDSYHFIVLIIAKYQHMSSGVRDKNINLAACLTELIQYRK